MGTKFFIPDAKDAAEAESVYEGIRKFHIEQMGASLCARAQVSTLREHFLKLGAQVIVTVRRIVLHLPQAFPYRDSFHRLALSLGAQSG
jgi:Transposase DDE domain group 1